jgi:hypothetical protein
MKSVFTKILVPVAMMLSVYSANSSAQTQTVGFTDDVTYIASLNQFKMDPASNLQNVRAGYVQLRTAGHKGSLSLTMFRPYYCPPGAYCMMMMPAPTTVQVPLSVAQTTSCGVRTFQGTLAASLTNGTSQKITLIDNTQNHCATTEALAPTEVIYETVTPQNGKVTHSLMFGNKLEIQNQVQIQDEAQEQTLEPAQ